MDNSLPNCPAMAALELQRHCSSEKKRFAGKADLIPGSRIDPESRTPPKTRVGRP